MPKATQVRIRPATPRDAAALSALGAATFRETFADANTPDDMARYLAATFTPDAQAAELADPAQLILLATRDAADASTPDGATLIGYAHLVAGPAPADVTGSAPIELKRLYVARAWHGQGVAQALMDAALAAARARGAETIWLGVWAQNPRAVAFYAKYGFTRVGAHTFLLGDDAQTDWLLAQGL